MRREQRLQLLSHTDELTQTHNRRYFMQYAEQELKRAQRSEETFAIVILDLDNFKQINDRSGHLVGDQVLRQVSLTFKEEIRQADIFARYGVMNLSSCSHKQIMSKSKVGQLVSLGNLQQNQFR